MRIGSIIIFHLSKLWKAKFFILCVWCNISRDAAEEVLNWSLLGVKGLIPGQMVLPTQAKLGQVTKPKLASASSQMVLSSRASLQKTLLSDLVIVNKLNCRYVVGKGGQYVVGIWSVCGWYVVSTWSVCGWYVVGNEGDVVGKNLQVCGR